MWRRLIILFVILTGVLIYAGFHPPTDPKVSQSRFNKIDIQGNAVGIWSGPWQCVRDQQTGLLWEVKTDNETIHDGDWTYSWHIEGIGVTNNGDCFFESERCDTEDLIRHANEEKTCGVDRWRLPTTQELLTLVSTQARSGDAVIDKDFFPHTRRGDYWTANANEKLESIFAHLGAGARVVNFIEGETAVLPYRNAAYVRLVADEYLENH